MRPILKIIIYYMRLCTFSAYSFRGRIQITELLCASCTIVCYLNWQADTKTKSFLKLWALSDKGPGKLQLNHMTQGASQGKDVAHYFIVSYNRRVGTHYMDSCV